MNTSQILPVLQEISLLISALLLVRVVVLGLYRAYPAFTLYLGVGVARDVALAFVVTFVKNMRIYAGIWVPTQFLLLICYVLVVLELYHLVLSGFPGIARMGRSFLTGSMAISMLGAATVVLIQHGGTQDPFPRLAFVLLATQVVSFGLAIFLLLEMAFLVYYPVTLKRNLVVHSFVFGLFFVGQTVVAMILTTVGPKLTRSMNLVDSGIALAALGGWLVGLRRQGEHQPVSLAREIRELDEERLLGRLTALNEVLVRAARQ